MNNITPPAPARDTRAAQANRARYAAPARTAATPAPVATAADFAPATAAYLRELDRAAARALLHTAPHMAHAAMLAVTPPARGDRRG